MNTPVTPSSVCDMQGEFQIWLRSVCICKPPADAEDLAFLAWKESKARAALAERTPQSDVQSLIQKYGTRNPANRNGPDGWFLDDEAMRLIGAERTQQEASIPEKLASLGWQAIECDLCGSGARAFPAAAVDQRARFEQFMRKSRTDKGVKGREKLLQRTEGGDYASDHAQRHWWTWQSALGLTRHSKDALTTRPTSAANSTAPMQPSELARAFHEAYERLAPSFSYETKPGTRVFDPTSANGRLMIAVCAELSNELRGSCAPSLAQQTNGAKTHERSNEDSDRGTCQKSTGSREAGRRDAIRTSGVEPIPCIRDDDERREVVTAPMAAPHGVALAAPMQPSEQTLPELPVHPDCHVMTWTESEKRAITAYAHQAIAHFLETTGQYVTNDASREAVRTEAYAEGWQDGSSETVTLMTEKRLIGWRTENYLWETTDSDMAKSWEANLGILPIFEGDPNTKLAAGGEASALWLTQAHMLCTVCGKTETQHGTYPTCASHPYTPDENCRHVIGARCLGSECDTKGCIRGAKATGSQP